MTTAIFAQQYMNFSINLNGPTLGTLQVTLYTSFLWLNSFLFRSSTLKCLYLYLTLVHPFNKVWSGVVGWDTLPVKVQGWEIIVTDIMELTNESGSLAEGASIHFRYWIQISLDGAVVKILFISLPMVYNLLIFVVLRLLFFLCKI